jgi:hypothetical protein
LTIAVNRTGTAELAYNLNQKIRKVSDHSEWKNGLVDFGADSDDLSDTPDEWLW